MKILFLESFYGGSHKDFALGFKAHSAHDVDLVTMPDRFWKWRMRGAGLYFADQVNDVAAFNAVFATDMMDLTDFMALAGSKMPPVLLYFHENQLDYPLSPGEKRDFHLGFTNIVSARAASCVLFNSNYHMAVFMHKTEKLLRKMPDCLPGGILEEIKGKSLVAYPGCRFETGPAAIPQVSSKPPLIVWNHRWEHDKDPDTFYEILMALKKEGIAFELAVMGENFSKHPPVFERIKNEFSDRIKVFGYVREREAYVSWLKKGDVVISCARQENFGISVVEAVRYGCLPILPERLSYPELIPEKFHEMLIYKTQRHCLDLLKNLLTNREQYQECRFELSNDMEKFSWHIRVKQYDKVLKNLQNHLDLDRKYL